jgi:hypothetical protein
MGQYDRSDRVTVTSVQVGESVATCVKCGRALPLDRTVLILRGGRVRCALPCGKARA